MGQGMSEVLPGVYVTSAIVARQAKVLDEFGITHVISIQAKPISPFENREYLRITAKDHVSQDLLQYASRCNDFIHKARLGQGKIIIHCVEGKSRSPSIACIYMMTITGMSWFDIINSIRGVRMLVDPNFAFQRQLKNFHDRFMVQERERLFEKFGRFDTIDSDVAFVNKNLTLYHEEQQRRLTGQCIHIEQLSLSTESGTKNSSAINELTEEGNEYNPELDKFFEDSELSSMTPESRTLLDEMFSA